MLDPTKPFEIFADTSNYMTGAVLIQRDDNRVQHPCFFYSKPLLLVEKCYHTSEQEFLTIIQAIQEWRHYIDGAPEETIIWTDHNNIIYWTNPSKLSRRMTRWSTTLSAYKIKIKHIAGNKNTLQMLFLENSSRTKMKTNQNRLYLTSSSTNQLSQQKNYPTSRPWRKNKTYSDNIMTHQQLDTLVSRKHYAKCQNNTHGLDSNSLLPTTSKAVKTARDTRSTNIL